jgi:putative ABC transport system permease protein
MIADLIRIAAKNLSRYQRRTWLTVSLIVIGVLSVTGFMAVSGSFKTLMIGQITDSFVGHIQIHRKGYLAAIDTLPLTLNMPPQAVKKVETILEQNPDIEAYSLRVKFGGMFSNFIESTNIRLNGVDPEKEAETVPLLLARVSEGEKTLSRGEILVPELLARGMNVTVGDTVVVIATNRDGSVNGKQLTVGGILQSATGPGGRDGYVHMHDAVEILRMEEREISEIAIRVRNFDRLEAVQRDLEATLSADPNQGKKAAYEVHTWENLSPFYHIARMIDVMTVSVKLMLTAVVLISIMNVMMMAVYERVREIGTIAAIGTLPRRILSLFLIEGCLLGAGGAAIGSALSIALIHAINLAGFTYDFGRQTGIVLTTSVNLRDLLVISGIVVAVAVAASLQPAIKASRMDPIQALGYV